MISIELNKILRPLILIICFMQILLVSSCKVDVESPNNLITKKVAFSNDASATSALLGIYSTMSGVGLNDPSVAASLFTGLASDELTYNGSASLYAEYSSNSIQPANAFLQTHWTASYKIIYQCNQLLDALNDAGAVSLAVKKQLSGEALFIRSLIYFNLINEFGAVPLIITPDYDTSQSAARTAVAEIQTQILNDLIAARGMLTDTYPTAGRVRVNKSVVTALLAKFYLYQGKYKDAEIAATEIINSPAYVMEPDLNNVFLAPSREAILQIMPSAPGYNTSFGYLFVPSSLTAIPNYSVSSNLISSIEIGDNRRVAWISDRVIKGNTYSFPYKYKISRSSTVTEYSVILRLADLYLIRAEARVQQDNISDAVDDLNVIRTRARNINIVNALPNILKDISKDQALQAIARERRIELFSEGANRWIDLKRTKQLNNVMSVLRPSVWQSTDELFPIPQSEILLNVKLDQNPGYKK